uniref:[histone H4]-lysine(20) N-methyltransferase n=1 Tax=Phallusia mammillata TaxID=59560 RepID=A0A6F9DGZ1_9ASCI|nr:N-lysine methyltransferase SETD8-A [Phallusia mammillata]
MSSTTEPAVEKIAEKTTTKTSKRKKGKTKVPAKKNSPKSPEGKQTEIQDFCSPNSKLLQSDNNLTNRRTPEKESQNPKRGVSGAVNISVTAKMVPSPTDIGFLKMSPFVERKQVKTEQSDYNQVNNVETQEPFPASPLTKGKRNATRNKSSKSNKQVKASIPVSHKLTDFYPVRRSSRKTNSLIKKEQEEEITKAILDNCEDGMKVVEFPGKGRGVVSTRPFSRGEFVVEYAGDLVSWPEARKREQEYQLDAAVGCYMYYFNAKGQNFCIDATSESGRLGRLLNHSRRNPNCLTRLVWVQGNDSKKILPRLVIVAKREITTGEELTYDYGDRDRSALEVHPWLKN